MPDNNTYSADYTFDTFTSGYTLDTYTCDYDFDTDVTLVTNRILLESGDSRLLESGDVLLLG